jgi:hypothetical protein
MPPPLPVGYWLGLGLEVEAQASMQRSKQRRTNSPKRTTVFRIIGIIPT